MRRILITGGAGFLGSHLAARLIAEGNHVICLDNFSSGSKKNIINLLQHPQFELLEHDICAPFFVEVDEIYNLASPASPPHYQRDPIQTIKTNFLGALQVLELAKKLGRVKVLQASTSEVYGDPMVHPQTEDYFGHVNPIGIRACYDEGKRCAETLFFDFHRMHGIPIKVARIFNTYGPHMQPDDGRVISNFIMQALSHKPITIYGKGSQTRSFCYVDDLIEGFIALMQSNERVIGPINLGNPNEVTMTTLAEQIITMTSSRSQLVYQALPSDDPKKRCPDIALAKELLSWQPKVPLKMGLEKTIAYFSQYASQLV